MAEGQAEAVDRARAGAEGAAGLTQAAVFRPASPGEPPGRPKGALAPGESRGLWLDLPPNARGVLYELRYFRNRLDPNAAATVILSGRGAILRAR